MKIFVTLGSSTQNFNRLLKKLDELKKNKDDIELIVQSNSSEYIPKNYNITSSFIYETFIKNIIWADVIICHGGVGSIMDGIKYNKCVISFPRLKEYKEAVNNHQVQIVNKFCKEGYILSGNIENLEEILKKSENFIPKKYKSNNTNFNNKILKIIDNLK